MSELLNESILSKKTEMYAMIISIEADFVYNFGAKLELQDIPGELVARSNKVDSEINPLLKILKGLDIQAYIEICNRNITKLSISAAEKAFLNIDLHKIIPIRNAVMHPRPLGIYDYPMLKAVFAEIDKKLPCFSWHHLEHTRIQIEQHPETLSPPPILLKKNERIIENLPLLVDYEETSFIGRKREIGEIRAQLSRKNVHILSIIGDGGVGKTALVLKLLYDMLDDPKCDYELIIWVSLKTTELSDHDFVDIKNSITTVSEMYERLVPFVGADDINNTQEYIIDLAKNFNTLFVLDNLETLNTSEIREFIDVFSEYGKILITSRIGLGEMEHRYRLKGLNNTDVIQYADVLLDLYGYGCYFSEEQKIQLFCNELHANPLAIKWFIRCMYNGQSEDEILKHKDDLVDFCMANVYDKLSDDARTVLDILTAASVGLSLPELMYYLNRGLNNSVQIRYAINELGKCNFISEDEFRTHSQVVVTEFARDFLFSRFTYVRPILTQFKELEQRITSFGQTLLSMQAAEPYKEQSMLFSNKGELVIDYFLSQVLKDFRAERAINPFETIKFTQEILPQFFECNLALASVYGVSSPLKAKEEYNNAIKFSRTPQEKLRSSLLYTDFLIRSNEYLAAIDFLNNLQKEFNNCMDIHFEKAKALGCVNQFDDALTELEKIDNMGNAERLSSKVISKRADIYRRKANTIDARKTQEKLANLKTAFSFLESTTSDRIITDHMVDIFIEISHLYMDNDALSYLYEKLGTHIKTVRKSRKFKDFSKSISDTRMRKDNDLLKKIAEYTININEYIGLLHTDEVMVYSIKEGYGFCKNSGRTGIYFSMSGLPADIEDGDILSYTGIFESKNGPQLISAYRTGNIFDRIKGSNHL